MCGSCGIGNLVEGRIVRYDPVSDGWWPDYCPNCPIGDKLRKEDKMNKLLKGGSNVT